ncbi:MAG: RDD family protein [Pyrinomonadaceae bacterium]
MTKIKNSAQVAEKEYIKGFDPVELHAPFILRCGAMIIDYMIVLAIPVGTLLLGRMLHYDGAKLLNSEINNTGWLIAILVCATNFLILPMFGGQSLGKMLTGLRIVRHDGTTPGFAQIAGRHLIGYPMTLFSAMLGFVLAAFNVEGRALHDYLSGTVVVYGKPERKVKTLVKKSKSAAPSARSQENPA